jgi:hypothetical protein
MRQVGPCFSRMGIDTVEGVSAQITIIFQGMKSADAAVTMEKVDAIKGVTFSEIRQAVQRIGELCGLKTSAADDAPEGEAAPAPGPAAAA